MKTNILFILVIMFTLVSCKGEESETNQAAMVPEYKLNGEIISKNWVRPYGSIQGKQGWEGILVRDGYVNILHYAKTTNDGIDYLQDEYYFDIVAVREGEIEAVNRLDATDVINLAYEDYGLYQQKICINNQCYIYDPRSLGDL